MFQCFNRCVNTVCKRLLLMKGSSAQDMKAKWKTFHTHLTEQDETW